MAISETQRHHLHTRLDQVLGEEDAAVPMSHLPPSGWSDVVRIHDLDARLGMLDGRFGLLDGRFGLLDGRIDTLEARIDGRFAAFQARIDGRFDTVEARFDTVEARIDAVDARADARMHELSNRIVARMAALAGLVYAAQEVLSRLS